MLLSIEANWSDYTSYMYMNSWQDSSVVESLPKDLYHGIML